MSTIETLLKRIDDPQLRADLSAAVSEVRRTKDFGLVFESHLPEAVRLPHHPIRRGVKVARRDDASGAVFMVTALAGGAATITPLRDKDGVLVESAEPEEMQAHDLVVVAEFGDPIYPGLKNVGSVRRGDEKPSHVVVNGENHHSLEALQFTHAGKVDCIYIDPPYNTGNRDWTYNNDFVDGNDGFRHSKWLSFIERRLHLARTLLHADGTLIVTIDEHEVNNLGLLLRQTFPEARVQMVTIVMNTAGSTTPGQFSRADEYAFFCRFGNGRALPLETDLLSGSSSPPQLWFPFHRSRGLNDRPSKRPNLVYPIAIDPETFTVHAIGPSLEERVASGSVSGNLDEWMPDLAEDLDGCPVVWPVLDSGEMSVWQANAIGLQALIDDGFFRVRTSRKEGPRPFTLAYVKKGNREKVLSGEFQTVDYEVGGARIVKAVQQDKTVKTVWKVPEHDARLYGTTMLRSLLGATSFTYPKSPYAVADALRTAVSGKKDAVVLDFFAGSGTTLQAVAMLNEDDGGRRQAILVTNNEVDDQTSKRLRADGLAPGDDAYEARGVFHAVTVPRVRAAIEGTRDGAPIEGTYVNEKPIAEGFEENVEFFTLTYQDAARVELDMAFNSIAPLLWMRAGAEGDIIEDSLNKAGRRKPYAWTDTYAVLFNTDCWRSFVDKMPATVGTVFVVTDSPTEFAHVAAEMPAHVHDKVRLYERYLTTFAINDRSSV